MTDFTQLSAYQIIEFIDLNFHLFASDRSDEFPAKILADIQDGLFAVVCIEQGFAVAFKGRRFAHGAGFIDADLMFLYVAPEFERKGFASILIEKIKAAVTPGAPILL